MDRKLLVPCKEPQFVADPNTASDTEFANEKLSVGTAWACNKVKFTTLGGVLTKAGMVK